MDIMKRLNSKKTIIYGSIIAALFIIYPNINNTIRTLSSGQVNDNLIEMFSFFTFRYVFFVLLIWTLLTVNIKKIQPVFFTRRLLTTLGITLIAYGVYILISFLSETYRDCFTGVLVFQFIVSCLLCAFIGHLYTMYAAQVKHEKEMEQLKLENLQSRYDALTNQINPHFLFNTINGLTALVREDDKEKTLAYTSNMSALFRYILQSDRKGLVPLQEELDFLDACSYLYEVRYEDKLSFHIDIPKDKLTFELPVLSFLPLIENVVKHNRIDCENPMQVSIFVNDNNELVISNPIHEKIEKPIENGIGLSNLAARFKLLSCREIRIEQDKQSFVVYLPLKQSGQ